MDIETNHSKVQAEKQPAAKSKAPGKKENRDFANVKVKTALDFDKIENVFERREAMLENRYTVFIHNLLWLIRESGKSQNEFCRDNLKDVIGAPFLSECKKAGKEIPFRKMVEIACLCNKTVEQMCTELLDQNTSIANRVYPVSRRTEEEVTKYFGTYELAFFDTSQPNGRNVRTTESSLAQGILTFFKGTPIEGVSTIKACAFINATDDEKAKLLGTLGKVKADDITADIERIYESVAAEFEESTGISRQKNIYVGEMVLTDLVARVFLRQKQGIDSAEVVFHNRAAGSSKGKKYIGGLATIQSISRGEQHMPCIQALVLSRFGFQRLTKTDIADMLYMNPPQVDLSNSVKAIVAYTKMLYLSDTEQDLAVRELSDEDKTYCIESFAEKKLLDIVKRNMVSYYKVSVSMDDDVYKQIKEQRKWSKSEV